MIKGVIFDLGSTLMYLDKEWKDLDGEATARLVDHLRQYHVPAGDDFPARFGAERVKGWQRSEETRIEYTVEEAVTATLKQIGFPPTDGLVTRAVESYFSVSEQHWQAYPDAISTLRALRESNRYVGLVSNADDDGLVRRSVVRLGFAPFLDPVISSAAFRWRKPDARIFHHVAGLWQLPPEQIAMVGDAPKYDILGAHQAGMKSILIDRQENHLFQAIPEGCADDPGYRADVTVHLLHDLLAAVERL